MRRCVSRHSQIALAVLGIFHAVSSFLMRVTRRASSLASGAVFVAAEVPVVSHQPGLCNCRGGGGYVFCYRVKNSISIGFSHLISEILFGCEGRKRSFGRICATTRCLQSPSDRIFCRGRKAEYCVSFVQYVSVEYSMKLRDSKHTVNGLSMITSQGMTYYKSSLHSLMLLS